MGDVDSGSRYVDYGKVADCYRDGRALSPAVLDRWRDAVLPRIPQPPVRVVDVGAGTGMFAAAWSQWLPASVIAVEPSAAMIRAGHEGVRYAPGVRYVQGVAEYLPLATGCADVVWISTALHHFTDLPRAVWECVRVLRDAGRLLVRTFLPGRTEITWMGAFPGREKAFRRFMDLDRLAAVFAPHGLVVDHVGEVFEEVWSFAESAEWVRRMRHADSMLTALTDDEVAAGIRALRAEPHRQARNELSLVVFRRA